MIVGLDSSFDVPSLAQARQARAAGVRVWGGYFGSMDGLGLAVRWSREQFEVLQQADLVAIGFWSGWDDPDWIRETAAAWGIIPICDVEPGIREDGSWVRPAITRARSGLYGLASVHHHTGEPTGRDALCNIVARYPAGGCSSATWDPAAGPRPPGPCGWQCQGTHQAFGLSVDRSSLDDAFLALAGYAASGGGGMSLASESSDREPFWEVRIRAADRYVMLAWWSGGMGQRDSYTGDLTSLGRPPGAALPVAASVTVTTHVVGHLRANVTCTTEDGAEWGYVYGDEPGAAPGNVVQGWVLAGTPANCPAVYVPSGASAAFVPHTHVTDAGHTS